MLKFPCSEIVKKNNEGSMSHKRALLTEQTCQRLIHLFQTVDAHRLTIANIQAGKLDFEKVMFTDLETTESQLNRSMWQNFNDQYGNQIRKYSSAPEEDNDF